MVFIATDTWENNSVEEIIVNDIKWLNETHVKKQLGHSNLREITSKYSKYFRKKSSELQKCGKQPCRRFLREDFAI